MPRRLGRLWRSGARRAEVTAEPREREDSGEVRRRLEAARQRLRQAIPPPEDPQPEDRPERSGGDWP